jgi:ABC-type multidrug transport system permease subunit
MTEPPRYYPLVELTLARLRELYREPGIVFWVFVFPVLLAVGLGLAFREVEPPRPRVAVVGEAQWVMPLFEGDRITAHRRSESAALDDLRVGRVDLVITPSEVVADRGVTYRFDPKNSDSRLARLVVDDALQRRAGRRDVVASQDAFVTEKGARYIDFLLPGLIGMNVMGSSMWGMAYSLVLNRKRRQLKRVAATPMRRSHYLLAYVISRVILLWLEIGFIAAAGFLIFGVEIQGPLSSFALVSLAGAAGFAGMGLLIAARLENTEVASGWMNFVMLPMWLLSGCFFSYEKFPAVIHPLIKHLPLTALNDALRAIANHANSLLSVGPELAVIAVWGVGSFALAMLRFRWQ